MFKLKKSENAFTVAYRSSKKSKCGQARIRRSTQQCHRAQALSASLPVSLVMSATLPHHGHVPGERREKQKKHQDIFSHICEAGNVCHSHALLMGDREIKSFQMSILIALFTYKFLSSLSILDVEY